MKKCWALESLVTRLFFVYVFCLFAATALFQNGLFERDGYYHARLSQLMPERGISQSFPWTQLSTWKDRYCDKEFLYHVAMMPFAQIGSEPILGARIFATILSVAVIGALYLVLRAHKVRWPLFFAALPFAMGGLFIARLGMIRSHVLSMLLLMFGVHFVLQRRWRALFVLGFVFAWSYTVPFVLLITVGSFAVGQWLGRGGFDYRSVAAAGTGSVLGLVLHPYSPMTLETFLTYVQIFRIGMEGVGKSGFELGNEIYPYSLSVFFDIYPLILILIPLLVLFVLVRKKRLAPETLGVVLSALCWFGMTMASARFVEYSVLLLAIAIAFAARDTLSVQEVVPRLHAFGKRLSWFMAAAAIGTLLAFHVYSMKFYVYYQTKVASPPFFQGASLWMEQHLAPDETVINLFWDDFPDLFYAAPRQRYIWGLDPTYTIRYDRNKAVALENFRRHLTRLDGRRLADMLQAHWLILRAGRVNRYPELRSAPFWEAYRDNAAVLFKIE
jgi:hypothetical protein